MYQQDNTNFRSKESLSAQFYHSCFGKIVLFLAFVLFMALIAMLTNPSEMDMRESVVDDIMQTVGVPDSLDTDWLDDAINNIGNAMTDADSTINLHEVKDFLDYNRIECFSHGIYSTALLFNNFHPEGERCAVGFFGFVISTVNYNDFVRRDAPMRRDYNRNLGEDHLLDDFDTNSNADQLIFRENEYE